MTLSRRPLPAARCLRAAFVSALFFILSASSTAVDQVPSHQVQVAGSPNADTAKPASAPIPEKATPQSPVTRPLWRELTPMQQKALAPLSSEWDRIEAFRKKKWLEIGNRFPSMKPEEQMRLIDRMREWTKLTPEQRRSAREIYARTKKLNADQKSAQWQKYQELPDEQKKKLARDAASKKPVANLPSPQSTGSTGKTSPPATILQAPGSVRRTLPEPSNQPTIPPSSPPIEPVTP